MPTLESLRRRIDSARQLQDVVKTMKSIAAVNVRQYEEAEESVSAYRETVETGFQVVVRSFREVPAEGFGGEDRLDHAIIIGSAQGMCGQFNEELLGHVTEQFGAMRITPESIRIAGAGSKALMLLEADGFPAEQQFSLPSSVPGITHGVQEILGILDHWRSETQLGRVQLFYNRKSDGTGYRPTTMVLFPLNPDWLRELAAREWPTNQLPAFTIDREELFAGLVRHYLFLNIYQAFAFSLAAENSARLAAMQAAESNIEEHLHDLEQQQNHLRQESITSEILDISSGYEALQTEGD